jgi:hypothetical protein
MISGLAQYPGGAMGAGLLLLRFSVAGSLLKLSVLPSEAANWLEFLVVLGATGLCAGLRTRVIASLSLTALFVSAPSALSALHAVDALALILTGPGAWSVDAFLFGRRTVTLPDREDTIV